MGGLISTTLARHPVLHFYGFGAGRVERDDQVIALNSVKARRLTFYLLMHPPRSRDQNFAVFYDTGQSVATFHSTKYQAQKALGRRFIVYEDGFYKVAWDPDCWFDVDVFEALLDGRPGWSRRCRSTRGIF